jgi:hypothetical protein
MATLPERKKPLESGGFLRVLQSGHQAREMNRPSRVSTLIFSPDSR